VLVSSINGERGKVGQANYAASKAGLIALARTAARELGRFGVRVNAVAPGLIRTAMTADLAPEVVAAAVGESALGRAGEAEDVARAVLFLCSDFARHVTGQVLRVDGGQLIA
jgi:NAD(P)-dependent dehydrogenase (short-subunit alcohol dehydrogenase family)